MREDFAHPGLNPLSFFISLNCQTSVLDFGISLEIGMAAFFLSIRDLIYEAISFFYTSFPPGILANKVSENTKKAD